MMFGFSEHAFILIAALVLDALVGDPAWLWRRIGHPVVWAGRMIDLLEGALNETDMTYRRRVSGGILSVVILVGGALCLGGGLEWLLSFHPVGYVVLAMIASVFIAQRGLYDHVIAVEQAFDTGGLAAAREAVALIVGRDPQKLDASGVSRAAIESCAENFSDGVVAPALWYLAAGLPGLMAYKVLNTADSVIGYRSARFRAFGWAAARLDDVANFIPSRLAGLLIALAAPLSKAAFKAMFRDARQHRSPNAGWPEAAMAAALGLALAGPRIYEGEIVEDSWMNKGGREAANAGDIGRALGVFMRSSILFTVLILLGGLWFGFV